jgi:hypothetical protein
VHSIESVAFENGSKSRVIRPSALACCEFRTSIAIPPSLEIPKCDELEDCLIDEDANLVRVGKEAFSDCYSLRSFYVPKSVEGIGSNCFSGCGPLYRLKFASGESLKKIVGDLTLVEARRGFGFNDISSLFRIELNQGAGDLTFPGWVSVRDGDSTLVSVRDGDSTLVLAQAN